MSQTPTVKIMPLFYFGILLLSLILVVTTSPQQIVFSASDDDEKEEEEKEESEDKEDETKDEEDKEEEESEDKEEKEKDEPKEETNTTTEEQPQPPLTLTPPEPIINLTTEGQMFTTTSAPPVLETTTATIPEKLDLTCNCTTTTTKNKELLGAHPSVQQQQQQQQEPEPQGTMGPLQQIPISIANIVSYKSLGKIVNADYTGNYSVPNMFDNKINDVSFWSQYGTKSGFIINLDNTLDGYQVCSIDVTVHNPKGVNYVLDIGLAKNYTGVIDQTIEKIQFEKCIKNIDELTMIFDSDKKYISIAEIKLFGNKLGAATATVPTTETKPSTLIPVLEPPIQSQEEQVNKINIEDSKAEIDIKNSTVSFKFDPLTATFVGQNAE